MLEQRRFNMIGKHGMKVNDSAQIFPFPKDKISSSIGFSPSFPPLPVLTSLHGIKKEGKSE
jgi:hypothetical protein